MLLPKTVMHCISFYFCSRTIISVCINPPSLWSEIIFCAIKTFKFFFFLRNSRLLFKALLNYSFVCIDSWGIFILAHLAISCSKAKLTPNQEIKTFCHCISPKPWSYFMLCYSAFRLFSRRQPKCNFSLVGFMRPLVLSKQIGVKLRPLVVAVARQIACSTIKSTNTF